jgi:CheY-like chemotaxis protein
MTKPSEEEFRQAVDTIERNTRIQTQLIDDLLDMSRIISGKVRLEVQRVDLATVIEAAAESVRPAFDARQIRLQTVMDSIGRVVAGDINRLQQVIWNLLSNAAKFTPKGGRVQVVLERVNSHIEVSVIDTGAGIKPEFLPHVFERFQQADSSSTRGHGGLGLGLAIVRHLVELHGGSVRAKSPGEGKGSTFIVSLPLTIMHADEAPEAREHPTMSGATENEPDCPPALQGVRVLVVDDEVDALQIVKRVLEICGCIVLTAGSAEEAFQLVQRESPQVLISDIGMPGQDGFELLKRVRALSPEKGGRIPAIALTAFARTDDRRKAMMAGFQLHMAKPVESAELIAAVANVAGLTGYS